MTPYLFIMIVAVVAITFIFISMVIKGKSRENSAEVQATLTEINEGVQELRSKVAAIEKLLREVE
ncbi:MAG: hypothetical protein KJZ53_08345 [Anaerolineales bacterium]|nr:hypothetical protein [Anaerolineales bacterium]QYK50141.1 MAG: hypothetical protein KF701_07015 [Anaerolineales bacterium]